MVLSFNKVEYCKLAFYVHLYFIYELKKYKINTDIYNSDNEKLK